MTKPRKQIAHHGARGRWVRVFLERGHQRITVQWRVAPGIPDQQSFPNTPAQRAEALAYAEGVYQRLTQRESARPSRLTLQDLWDRYKEAEFPHLRPRTRELYTENFRRWALVFGWHMIAEQTTPEMADNFRTELTARKLALKTIRNSIDDVKRVFSWAEARELIARNRLRLYRFKVAKEDRAVSPAEYRTEDFEKILAQLDPTKSRQWRAFVALSICGAQGARQNAVLHLTPADVLGDTIYWRAEWDKVGKAWSQPMRQRTLAAVKVALHWRERDGYNGPWLLYSAKTDNPNPYSIQSLWLALKGQPGKKGRPRVIGAQQRAGIEDLKGRAGHGLRRMLAGDIAAATGNATLALKAIGDTDLRMANRYLKDRDDDIREAFELVDRVPEPAPNADSNAQPMRNLTNDERAEDGVEPSATLPSEAQRVDN